MSCLNCNHLQHGFLSFYCPVLQKRFDEPPVMSTCSRYEPTDNAKKYEELAILCTEILRELERAETIHPNWPSDPVHAAAILAEEAGEVVKAVNNVVTKHKGDSDYRTEAIQCAAMCIRFLKNLDKYDWGIEY